MSNHFLAVWVLAAWFCLNAIRSAVPFLTSQWFIYQYSWHCSWTRDWLWFARFGCESAFMYSRILPETNTRTVEAFYWLFLDTFWNDNQPPLLILAATLVLLYTVARTLITCSISLFAGYPLEFAAFAFNCNQAEEKKGEREENKGDLHVLSALWASKFSHQIVVAFIVIETVHTVLSVLAIMGHLTPTPFTLVMCKFPLY